LRRRHPFLLSSENFGMLHLQLPSCCKPCKNVLFDVGFPEIKAKNYFFKQTAGHVNEFAVLLEKYYCLFKYRSLKLNEVV
jgi:hypothetical protein